MHTLYKHVVGLLSRSDVSLERSPFPVQEGDEKVSVSGSLVRAMTPLNLFAEVGLLVGCLGSICGQVQI